MYDMKTLGLLIILIIMSFGLLIYSHIEYMKAIKEVDKAIEEADKVIEEIDKVINDE